MQVHPQEAPVGSRASFLDDLRYEDERADRDARDRSRRSAGSRSGLLLERIAATLEVPTSALRDLSHAAEDRPGSARAPRSEPSHHQCLELIRAFCRVGDPDERNRLLALVQEAAQLP